MTEPHHTETTSLAPESTEPEGKRIGTVGWIGVGMVVVIMLAGLAVSLVVLSRDQDTPLVPLDDSAGSSAPMTPQGTAGLFEPDPEFDSLDRVVYVPKDPNGVVLEQKTPPAGRTPETPPEGVMLQRVHNNMVLPFSTSDGPTAIDPTGVATGFSRSPQGAALAAAHYIAYFAGGNDRIDMLAESGRADDPTGTITEAKRYNATGVLGSIADGSAYVALPSLRLNYTDALTRVWFGYTATLKDGSTQYRRMFSDFVWREDRGWVIQVRPLNSPQGPTVGGSADSTPFEPGWLTWW